MFRVIVGFPCMHELAQLVNGECISFDLVVKYWYAYYTVPLSCRVETSNTLEAFEMEIYKLKHTYLQWMLANTCNCSCMPYWACVGHIANVGKPNACQNQRSTIGRKIWARITCTLDCVVVQVGDFFSTFVEFCHKQTYSSSITMKDWCNWHSALLPWMQVLKNT